MFFNSPRRPIDEYNAEANIPKWNRDKMNPFITKTTVYNKLCSSVKEVKVRVQSYVFCFVFFFQSNCMLSMEALFALFFLIVDST